MRFILLFVLSIICTVSLHARAASTNGATIPPNTQLVDASNNVWTLVNGQIAKNRTIDSVTSSVILLLYYNSAIYQENSWKNWYKWTGTGWVQVSADPRGPTTSANGATIPSNTQLVDANHDVWTLVNGQIAKNGTIDSVTSSVILLLYYNTAIYQENTWKNWYKWTGTGWVQVSGDPRGTTVTSPTPTPAPSSGSVTPPPQAAGYTLKFSDEFNSLNLSPNGLGNYTWYNPGMFWGTPAPYANITLSNSFLNLAWTQGQASSDTSIATAAKDGSYSRTWRYGYFEARFRWDVTGASWPAFWMIPIQGIKGAKEQGELDIFEGQGAQTHTFFGTIHDWNNPTYGHRSTGGSYNVSADMNQYHTYGVLWVPGKVTWYFDNQPIISAATYSIFDSQDYYLILGSQMGSNWSYGNTSGLTTNRINMNFDWVRVWQK